MENLAKALVIILTIGSIVFIAGCSCGGAQDDDLAKALSYVVWNEPMGIIVDTERVHNVDRDRSYGCHDVKSEVLLEIDTPYMPVTVGTYSCDEDLTKGEKYKISDTRIAEAQLKIHRAKLEAEAKVARAIEEKKSAISSGARISIKIRSSEPTWKLSDIKDIRPVWTSPISTSE